LFQQSYGIRAEAADIVGRHERRGSDAERSAAGRGDSIRPFSVSPAAVNCNGNLA
jgi:hypothetical protein